MSFITISEDRYDELVRAEKMLSALEAGGVDNWEWYSESLREFFKEEDDEEEGDD